MALHRHDFPGQPHSIDAAGDQARAMVRPILGSEAAQIAAQIVGAMATDALLRTPEHLTFTLTIEVDERRIRFEILDPDTRVEGRVPGDELATVSRLAHFSGNENNRDGKQLTWAGIALVAQAPVLEAR